MSTKKRVVKKVKSVKSLKKHALKVGAEVTDSAGKTFNEGGEKIDRKPLFPKRTGKPPVPEIKEPSIDAEYVSEAVHQSAAENREILRGIINQIGAIKFESERPPVEWVFDVVRNKNDGLISQVIAKAVMPKRIIN